MVPRGTLPLALPALCIARLLFGAGAVVTVKTPTYSNLGGLDRTHPSEVGILYPDVTRVAGELVDLQAQALGPYQAFDVSENWAYGAKHLGSISIQDSTSVSLLFRFLEKERNDTTLAIVDRFEFTVYFTDKHQRVRVYANATGAGQPLGLSRLCVANGTILDLEVGPQGEHVEVSPRQRQGLPAPEVRAQPVIWSEKQFTTYARAQTVTFSFRNVSQFWVDAGITGTADQGGHNFLFSGSNAVSQQCMQWVGGDGRASSRAESAEKAPAATSTAPRSSLAAASTSATQMATSSSTTPASSSSSSTAPRTSTSTTPATSSTSTTPPATSTSSATHTTSSSSTTLSTTTAVKPTTATPVKPTTTLTTTTAELNDGGPAPTDDAAAPATTGHTAAAAGAATTAQGRGPRGRRAPETRRMKSMVGCPRKNRNHMHEACVQVSQRMAVRCCGEEPEAAAVMRECFTEKTFSEAQKLCQGHGLRVCSAEELASNAQCGSSCDFDFVSVWTSTPCREPEVYDCLDQPDDWHEAWSVQQKENCCRSSGTGCYDCTPGHKTWSADKSEFCCATIGVGCSGAPEAAGRSVAGLRDGVAAGWSQRSGTTRPASSSGGGNTALLVGLASGGLLGAAALAATSWAAVRRHRGDAAELEGEGKAPRPPLQAQPLLHERLSEPWQELE